MESINRKSLVSKNILLLLLLFTLLFTITACTNNNEDETATEAPQAQNKENKKEVVGPYSKLIPTWSKMDGLKSSCERKKLNLAIPVNIIAANITKDSLVYNQEPFSDCSGVFLRVLDSLKKRCPNHDFPNPESYRDSRALARWYHEQGKLIRVKTPLEMDTYIKPGVVMFYGGRGAENETLTLDDLFAHGGINHVGVITAVEKDNSGKVSGYSLFHGQRPGKLASTTKYHKREYRNRPNYPPYGNGTEQWVAVAPIVQTDDPIFSL